MKQHIQIDVKTIQNNIVMCNMYTGGRCVVIAMSLDEYNALKSDGFFIRDGLSRDSAGVLNTTNVFYEKKDL